jgi:hypothetical protein
VFWFVLQDIVLSIAAQEKARFVLEDRLLVLAEEADLVEALILHQLKSASVLLLAWMHQVVPLALRRYECAVLLLKGTLCTSLHQGVEIQTHRAGVCCCISVCHGELTVSLVEWLLLLLRDKHHMFSACQPHPSVYGSLCSSDISHHLHDAWHLSLCVFGGTRRM